MCVCLGACRVSRTEREIFSWSPTTRVATLRRVTSNILSKFDTQDGEPQLPLEQWTSFTRHDRTHNSVSRADSRQNRACDSPACRCPDQTGLGFRLSSVNIASLMKTPALRLDEACFMRSRIVTAANWEFARGPPLSTGPGMTISSAS